MLFLPPLELDFRAEDLRPPPLRALLFRPPPLRRDEDFRAPPLRDDLRPPPVLRLLERLRAPPLLRPEDPDRDLFLPLLERLDFLAAAIGKLRVGGFVERIARFAHNKAATHCIRFDDASQQRVWIIRSYAFLRVA